MKYPNRSLGTHPTVGTLEAERAEDPGEPFHYGGPQPGAICSEAGR